MIRKYRIVNYNGAPVTASLVRVNLDKNINRYCNLSLLVSKSDICLETRTGRIGSKLKRTVTYYTDIQRALYEFREQYTQRTGNHWHNRLCARKTGMYIPFYKDRLDLNIKCETGLEDILTVIAKSIHTESSPIIPLGIPSREQYTEACTVLLKIKAVLRCKRSSLRHRGIDPDKYIHDETMQLSQRFFELIPSVKPVIISTIEGYITYRSVLRTIKGYITPLVITKRHLFSKLGTVLSILHTCETRNAISEYIDSPFQIKEIIQVNKPLVHDKSQRLMFRGIRARDISSILINGLHLSHRERLHLTESIAKAMQYSDKGFVLLYSVPAKYTSICAKSDNQLCRLEYILQITQSESSDSEDVWL